MKTRGLIKRYISGAITYRIYIFIFFALADTGLVIKYYQDNMFLEDYANQFLSTETKPSEIAVQLATAIRTSLIAKRNSGSFISPLFRFLRPTARQIAETGGDCADKSRLLITLLKLNSIEASKVALYDDTQQPRHAIVEVKIEDGNEMAIDAYFGLYFPKRSGGYYSVWDIQQDESILKTRIDYLIAQGNDNRSPRLTRYPYHKYVYRQPRTINWDKSFLMSGLYRLLVAVFGDEKINRIERPYIVERPALMILAFCISLQILISISYIPFFNNKLKRIPSSRLN